MGAKTDNSTTKYEIRASFEIDGVVEKPDIIGGIYGQTDGLLSENLDIRELQKTGRIGRINVELRSRGGKTTGRIFIPSSLSRMETAILAATLETVDRVGPCSCSVKLDEIVDVRINKRKIIVDRASEIMRQWDQNVSPFSNTISKEVEKSAKASHIIRISDEGFSAGPGFENQKKIILVEGRADVVNLLKYGIDNTVAVNGTSIPPELVKLITKKKITAFLDGDRGGDLILKELLQVSHVDHVARAPKGKEVEDLSQEQVKEALSQAVAIDKAIFLTGRDEGLTVKEFQDKSKPKKKGLLRSIKPKVEGKKKTKVDSKKTPTVSKTKKIDSKVKKTVSKPRTERPTQKPPDRKVTREPQRPRTTGRPPGRPSSSSRSPSRSSSSTRPSSRPSSSSRPSGRPSSSGRSPSRSSSSTRPSSRPSSSRGRPPGRPSSSRGRPSGRPPKREVRKVELPEYLSKAVKEIKTKLEAAVYDESEKEILRSPAGEIFDSLEKLEKGKVLVIDGVITQRLLERLKEKGISTVIGARQGDITKKPTSVKIIEYRNI